MTLTLESIEYYGFIAAFFIYFVSMCLYFAFFITKKETWMNRGRIVHHVAFALHTLSIILRAVAAGRIPMANQYEFATSFAWGISLVFIIFTYKYSLQALGAFAVPIIFVLMAYASLQNRAIRPLMPALQSYWLGIHVSMAIISYGAFGVSCAISILYVLKAKRRNSEFYQKHIPDLKRLDLISYRSIMLGFLFLTLVIITGAIWAEQAWGRYWAWDPKETWSLITWIIYAIYLHLRFNKNYTGHKAAMFSVIGFISVLFTYIGVNTLLPSLHSYL